MKYICKIFLLVCLLIMLSSFASCSEVEKLSDAGRLPSLLAMEKASDATVGIINPYAEVRGVWIATVGNLNFPSKKGLSEKALALELDAIVEKCGELGLNAIFFQVRPAADALYSSDLFPASEYVSGKQGVMPEEDFDCLRYLTDIAHKAGISVHAWVNPLRVTYGSAKYPKTDISVLSEDHIARKNTDWVIPYADGKLYFDAGNPWVRDYVAMGVREIAENYDVDGIVFDDYFYPYPVSGAEFDDSLSFSLYGGGDVDTWRRGNIDQLVKLCHDTIKEVRSNCLFGISPFGIWKNDDGVNGGSKTAGLEAYYALYCDALGFAKKGYVDYLAPQLYWSFETESAPYGELCDWWASALSGSGTKLYISHAAYKYEEWDDPDGELTAQIEYARKKDIYRGSLLYGFSSIIGNASGICDEISSLFEKEIIYW